MADGQGYTPFSNYNFGGGQPQNSQFNNDIWGGTPFLPGQGGQNSIMSGNPASSGFNWGLNPETFGAVSQGIGGLTSLAQIYGMFQNLGLQKKAFKFGQEGTKRNFNASATGFNNEIVRRENLNQSLAAVNPSTDYGSLQSYGKVDKWT